MSEPNGKPLETLFEVVIRFENKESADDWAQWIHTNTGGITAEVREVAK